MVIVHRRLGATSQRGNEGKASRKSKPAEPSDCVSRHPQRIHGSLHLILDTNERYLALSRISHYCRVGVKCHYK